MECSQLESYLERIGMTVPATPSLEALKQIQERHIYAIPVENLDIIHGRLPLSLETDDLIDKVVRRRRGGLSFELNLLLADALGDLGYGVKLMSARHPRYGHEFDHAFLMVTVPGDAGEWLVDVGYTEGIPTPLLFDERIWQGGGREDYTFCKSADVLDAWDLLRRRKGEVELVYSFNLREHEASEYTDQCNWFCTNSESRFTQGPFVFIERPEGRICLTADTVVNLTTGEQIRPVIKDKDDGRAALREIFGLEVEDGGAEEGKFGYKRVFAAIGDDALQGEVIAKAAGIAVAEKAHLRFGHIVQERPRDFPEGGFPAYVQSVRQRLIGEVAETLAELGVENDLFGGEVVVMGSNSRIGVSIDAPADYAPDQLIESMIKPFNPDIVVCGDTKKSKLRSFIQGSTSEYLSRKLDCEVVKVSGSGAFATRFPPAS